MADSNEIDVPAPLESVLCTAELNRRPLRPPDYETENRALAASRTLNSDPQKVTDPAFAAGGFFDPADLLQVKYEMVRQIEVDGVPVPAAASAFGFARQSVYNARAALAAGGLAALIPAKPGPKGGHKLTGPVLDHLEALLEQDPG